jgi:predicted nucleic acid-binding Zn ribbon protein
MYCTVCGTKLRFGANFCSHCGEPRKQDMQAVQTTEEQWEYCEIIDEVVKKVGIFEDSIIRFWTKAIGPNGSYSAGTTENLASNANGPAFSFYGKKHYQEQSKHVDALVAQLLRDGWVITQTDSERWWNYKFRRKVR